MSTHTHTRSSKAKDLDQFHWTCSIKHYFHLTNKYLQIYTVKKAPEWKTFKNNSKVLQRIQCYCQKKTWYYYSTYLEKHSNNEWLPYYHIIPCISRNTTLHWLDCPYVVQSDSITMVFLIYTIVLNVYHIHLPCYLTVL